ncbi:MAG: CBS domain-containing protein, partial [Coriobacteriia bacterium]|nr:CBS domain-containing protein [Coriobacteriia bacterium]
MELVVGHANPDFDAYAATVAATKLFPGARGVFLGTQAANVRAFHNLHEDFVDFVDLRGLDLSRVQRLIMVDTRDPNRIGDLGQVALDPGVDVIVYDHHRAAEGDLSDIDDRSLEVGATTSILVHELHQRGIALTALEASLMLLGIHEDTGSLTYPGTTAYDAEAVAYLMAAGADMEVLNQFLTRALDPEQRRLLQDLLDSLEVWNIRGQQIAVGVASTHEYVDSASVLTHYIVEDLGYRVAIALVAMPGRLQVVARSRLHEVDVGEVMALIGGGGHAQAASAGLVDMDTDRALTRVRDALESCVRPPLRACDILSAPVHTIDPETTMAEAGSLMARWGHGGLPVVEAGAIVGLVTRKDVDKAVRHQLSHAPVKGFMARDVVTITPSEDLRRVEALLASKGIGRLPVLRDGELVGIVTRKDLLRAEHGDEYLDHRLPQARARYTERFLTSVNSLLPSEARNALRAIGHLADGQGVRAHVVGGFVRDMLLGKRNLDIDVVVEGDGVAFAEAAASALGGRVKVHHRFGTAVLVLSRTLHIDITSARTEYYTRPGALPTVERSSLRQDLFRRDFTLNAIAACVNLECFGAIADPFGGLRDLERGVLRVLHSLSFVEDPTRLLRAARFERRFAFKMDGTTEQLARRAVEMDVLEEVSGARIREEMLDIIDEDVPSAVFERLEDLGILGDLLPENTTPFEAIDALAAAEYGYRTISNEFVRVPRRRAALMASIAAGVGRQAAERWLHKLRLGRDYIDAVLVLGERAESLGKQLKDRRKMKDSRLYRLLEPVPSEALIYLWGVGNELGRERIMRFVLDLSDICPAVSGE